MSPNDAKPDMPPMQNIGVMNKRQVNKLLDQFAADERLTVKRSDIICNVKTPKGAEIFSAAILRPGQWHVRARAGLITKQ